MSTKSEYADLRVGQNEFCTLWGCDRYEAKMPCTYCPFIKDVLDMAHDRNVEIPAWKYGTIIKTF